MLCLTHGAAVETSSKVYYGGGYGGSGYSDFHMLCENDITPTPTVAPTPPTPSPTMAPCNLGQWRTQNAMPAPSNNGDQNGGSIGDWM